MLNFGGKVNRGDDPCCSCSRGHFCGDPLPYSLLLLYSFGPVPWYQPINIGSFQRQDLCHVIHSWRIVKAQTGNLQAGLIGFVYVAGEWFHSQIIVFYAWPFWLASCHIIMFLLAFVCLFFWGCSYGLAGNLFCMNPILEGSHCNAGGPPD